MSGNVTGDVTGNVSSYLSIMIPTFYSGCKHYFSVPRKIGDMQKIALCFLAGITKTNAFIFFNSLQILVVFFLL